MKTPILSLLLLCSSTVFANSDDALLLQIVSSTQSTPQKTLVRAVLNQPTHKAWTASSWAAPPTSHPDQPIRLTTGSVLSCVSYCDLIKEFSTRYKVPQPLIMAVIKAESNFNTQAISHAGAKGLMQLMDIHSKNWNINPFDAKQNIKVGTALLSKLITQYNNIDLVLAAYNAGETAVAKYGGVPPYKETKQYIIKVKKYQKEYEVETNS